MALTAAVWSVKVCTGAGRRGHHASSALSLPPDARARSSGDHRRPHTSDLCAASLDV